jgi:mono/diheme cytochrome c family protein
MNSVLRNLRLVSCLAGAAAIGCDRPAPPAFHLNMVEAVENDTSIEYQKEIANVLGGLFGTPDQPYALPETGLDRGRLRVAAGPAWSDQAGTNHGLFRRHCVHCHGINGDGRGPTARFLNPYPRDYRQAVYKFKSTYRSARPTDDDLHRVLMNGVPGTAMPSFSLLPSSEVDALIEYVKYLSMRGQVETELIRYVYNELGEEEKVDDNGDPILDEEGEPEMERIALDPEHNADQRDAIMDMLAEIVDGWNAANEQIIVPDPEQTPDPNRSQKEIDASIVKGRELFYGMTANCVKCHGPTGLGDGQQDDQDDWEKAHKSFLETLSRESDPALVSEMEEVADTLYPVRNAIPRDLRKGIYRGGRRRIDLFWRIYAGIAGAPMPGLGPASAGATGTLTEEEMWNLVDYVLALPYEPPSRPEKALPLNMYEGVVGN